MIFRFRPFAAAVVVLSPSLAFAQTPPAPMSDRMLRPAELLKLVEDCWTNGSYEKIGKAAEMKAGLVTAIRSLDDTLRKMAETVPGTTSEDMARSAQGKMLLDNHRAYVEAFCVLGLGKEAFQAGMAAIDVSGVDAGTAMIFASKDGVRRCQLEVGRPLRCFPPSAFRSVPLVFTQKVMRCDVSSDGQPTCLGPYSGAAVLRRGNVFEKCVVSNGVVTGCAGVPYTGEAVVDLKQPHEKTRAQTPETAQARADRERRQLECEADLAGWRNEGRVAANYPSSCDVAYLAGEGPKRARTVAVPGKAAVRGKAGERQVSASGYALRYVPPGRYRIGCTSGRSECLDHEMPSHEVVLTSGYWMGESEVTQGLYTSVMGSNPSGFSSCGASCPVEKVSWFQAVEFANALSRQEGLSECYRVSGRTVSLVAGLACGGYRLPTESEWEASARAGNDVLYAGGSEVDSVAWYEENSGGKTHPVCQKASNPYGLCDMTGNVWEWTWDEFGPYSADLKTDPVGPAPGSARVYRGGSWGDPAGYARVVVRYGYAPGLRYDYVGFRLVRPVP